MPVSADAYALAVVRGDQYRGLVEVSPLLAPAEELFYLPVGGLDFGEIFGVVTAPGVAGLVDAQQVRVVAFHHGFGPGDQGIVYLVVVGDGGDRLHVAAEGIHQVSDSHQLSRHS